MLVNWDSNTRTFDQELFKPPDLCCPIAFGYNSTFGVCDEQQFREVKNTRTLTYEGWRSLEITSKDVQKSDVSKCKQFEEKNCIEVRSARLKMPQIYLTWWSYPNCQIAFALIPSDQSYWHSKYYQTSITSFYTSTTILGSHFQLL